MEDLKDWVKPSIYAKELSEKNGYEITLQRLRNWQARGKIESKQHPQLGGLVKRGSLTVRKYNNQILNQ